MRKRKGRESDAMTEMKRNNVKVGLNISLCFVHETMNNTHSSSIYASNFS